MKLKISVVFVILAYTLSSCNSKQNSLDENNVKGNVSKIYQNTFTSVEKFGKWEIGEKKYYGNYSMTFNEGYITEYIDYNQRNEIRERQVYSYDDHKVLLEVSSYDDGGKIKSKIKYLQDDERRISKIENYDSEGKIDYSYELEYAGGDKPTGGRYINTKGKIISSWKNEWDGNLLSLQLSYDSLNKLTSKTYYERNEKDDVVIQKMTTPNDSITSIYKFEYEYDNKGNWVKQTYYDDKSVASFVTRKIIYADTDGNNLNNKGLIGIWKEVGDNDWIEFKKDGTYDKGYNENIRDFGKWELNEEQKTLTFKSNDPGKSKKYSFLFEEQKLILSTIEGKDKTEFEKR